MRGEHPPGVAGHSTHSIIALNDGVVDSREAVVVNSASVQVFRLARERFQRGGIVAQNGHHERRPGRKRAEEDKSGEKTACQFDSSSRFIKRRKCSLFW
jgi:hypothetical protein